MEVDAPLRGLSHVTRVNTAHRYIRLSMLCDFSPSQWPKRFALIALAWSTLIDLAGLRIIGADVSRASAARQHVCLHSCIAEIFFQP